jgi:hypothetical protein
MVHSFSFCSIDQLLDLPDFRYTYTFSLQGFVNAITENPLPYVLLRKTSENFRIILHVIDKHYLIFRINLYHGNLSPLDSRRGNSRIHSSVSNTIGKYTYVLCTLPPACDMQVT